MTVWPGSPSIVGPELMSLGFSQANKAMADSEPEMSGTLANQSAARGRLRIVFDGLVEALTGAGSQPAWLTADLSARDLRGFLDALAQLEHAMLNFEPCAITPSERKTFQDLVAKDGLSAEMPSMEEFLTWLYETSQPYIRERRLDLIERVGRRAKSAQIDLLPDDVAAFRAAFMSAPFADTLAWQEMAHLAASPANARRLADTIAASARDRSEEIIRVPAAAQ
jgi:hypothetical protein